METDEIKKQKMEFRLMKNRESANKSRVKRKIEKTSMEQAFAELNIRLQELEQENSALLADNISLSNQNNELKKLLSERESGVNIHGKFSSVSALCVVFACSLVLNSLLPSTMTASASSVAHSTSSGRVLLSFDDNTSIVGDECGFSTKLFLFFACFTILLSGFYYSIPYLRKPLYSNTSILPS
jgi:hypothetical protein